MRPTPGLIIGIAVVFAAVTALVIYLNAQFPGALVDTDNLASVGVNVVWLALLLGSLILMVAREKLSNALKALAAWVGIFLVVLLGYAYRAELTGAWQRVSGELLPSEPTIVQPGVVVLRIGSDRHFSTTAEVNGQRVTFLVDTGASEVTLTYEDAQRVGLEVDRLSFTIPVNTANGVAMSARARVNRIRIGDLVFDQMPVQVAQAGRLHRSLLGMTLLNRLTSFEIRGTEMILRR